MTRTRISIIAASFFVLVIFAASLLKIQLAHAQTDATSTEATTSEPTSDDSTATTSPTPSPASDSLTLVHISGTKYVDYCTDGTTSTAYPGDAAIDANLDKPDAPTPQCPDGQTWDHTSGMDAFDTADGALGVGQYAQLPDGSFIVHYPASTYTDATSTAEWPDRIVSGLPSDPVTGAAAPSSESAATIEESAPPATGASTSSSFSGDTVSSDATSSAQ